MKCVCAILMLIAGTAAAEPGVKCRVEMDRDVALAGERQTAVVKVTLDAPSAPVDEERPPVNLCVVLDRSGSMSGEKIAQARAAAVAALERLGPRDIFSLVTYSDRVETVVPAMAVTDKVWIERKIRGINTGGNTALFAGVGRGASEIRKNLGSDRVHRLLLLSDGKANAGPSTPEELGRLGAALRKEGISVSTIGVGTDYNEDLMVAMSMKSDGNAYFVESSADLPRIFGAELGDVLSVVASQVTIEIEFPAGARPIRFIGRDGKIGVDRASISMNQLYGGQEKYALVEVELPAGAAGETREVAKARCAYRNMLASRDESVAGKTTISYSARPEVVAKGANVDVQREVVLNGVAEKNDKAIDLADNNEVQDAVDVMYGNYAVLNEFATANNDPEMQRQADQMLQQAEELKKNNFVPNTTRKSMRTWNVNIYNQQALSPATEDSADSE